MERQLTPSIEYAVREEIERQLSYSPEFSRCSVDHEAILQDVFNRLPSGSARRPLSFFQQERLREIVHEAIQEHVRDRTLGTATLTAR